MHFKEWKCAFYEPELHSNDLRITYVLTHARKGVGGGKAGITVSHLTAKEKVCKGDGWN